MYVGFEKASNTMQLTIQERLCHRDVSSECDRSWSLSLPETVPTEFSLATKKLCMLKSVIYITNSLAIQQQN